MRSPFSGRNERRNRSNLFVKLLQSLANFNSLQLNSIQFLRSLIDELVIISWLLAALLFLAQKQAYSDGLEDAINDTSTLPVVTLVAGEENIALGRNPGHTRSNPTGFRIIGDEKRYLNFFSKEITETNSSEGSGVWRLLIHRNGYFYIFLALRNEEDSSPSVVLIHEGSNGDRLVILSRNVSP